jgi:hypothetical protein
MDTTVVPVVASMEIIIDGTPETPITAVWQNPTTLRVVFLNDPTVSGSWRMISVDPLLRDADLTVAPLPQSQVFYP